MLPAQSWAPAVRQVRWLDVDPENHHYRNLYASHKSWVDKVAAGLNVPVAEQ